MISIKLSENGGRAPEAVPYMPAGLNHICCTVNGRAGNRTVMADAAACERLNADLQEMLQASKGGERARPVVLFDHKAGAAAAVPQGFEWDDKRGILLRVEWTQAGREAVEGGNYGYISPAFRLESGSSRILSVHRKCTRRLSLVEHPRNPNTHLQPRFTNGRIPRRKALFFMGKHFFKQTAQAAYHVVGWHALLHRGLQEA